MPEPRTKKKARRPVRFVKTSAPTARSPSRRKRAPKQASRPSTVKKRTAARAATAYESLPGWKDLTGSDAGSNLRRDLGGLLASVPTIRLAIVIVAAAALLTLYVGHVYATSALLAEVDALRRQNLELHLEHNQVKAAFDRATSPTTIVTRARALGLEESVPAGAVVHLDRR